MLASHCTWLCPGQPVHGLRPRQGATTGHCLPPAALAATLPSPCHSTHSLALPPSCPPPFVLSLFRSPPLPPPTPTPTHLPEIEGAPVAILELLEAQVLVAVVIPAAASGSAQVVLLWARAAAAAARCRQANAASVLFLTTPGVAPLVHLNFVYVLLLLQHPAAPPAPT